MVYTMTGQQEIAAPLASLYILRGSACYKSHTCEMLSLSQILRQLCGVEEHSCTMVPCGSSTDQAERYVAVSVLDDYVYRHDEFETYSLYEFKMLCFRKVKKPGTATSHDFKTGYRLEATHTIGLHRHAVVPVITGPKLPKATIEDSGEVHERHGEIALVLFKPFCLLPELLNGHRGVQKWRDAYEEWEPARSEFAITVMNNMYDYHTGRKRAQDAEDNPIPQSFSDSENDRSEDDGYDSEDVQERVGNDEHYSEEGILSCDDDAFSDHDDDEVPPETLSEINPRLFPSSALLVDRRHIDIIDNFERHLLTEGMAKTVAAVYSSSLRSGKTFVEQSCASSQQSLPTVEMLRDWVQDKKTDNCPELDSSQEHATFETRGIVIEEVLADALLPSSMKWIPPDGAAASVLAPLKRYSTLQDVSRRYTLNELEHVAFVMIGKALLKRWNGQLQSETIDSESAVEILASLSRQVEDQQLLMFLGGEGGTGKSRVIDAVNAFVTSWSKSRSVLKTALTGKAATLIGGQTFDSFKTFVKNLKDASFIHHLDLLIIDEVSMMSKTQLCDLDKILRAKTKLRDVPFGGILVVLAGDFLQLPPVKASPVYLDPTHQPKSTIKDAQGYELWKKFTSVVVLQQSMRFREDRGWGDGCRQARRGIWTDDFVDMINSRLLFGDPNRLSTEPGMVDAYRDLHKTLNNQTRFVVPDNAARSAINTLFTTVTDKYLPSGHHPIHIVANFKGVLEKLSRQDVKSIMALPDSSFGRLAPFLDVLPGMHVQVTQNVLPMKGVANGTMGVVESISFPPGTTFRLMKDASTGMHVFVPNQRPLFAILQIDRGPGSSPVPGIDQGSTRFPVFPDAEAYNAVQLSLTPKRDGSKRELKVKIQQFPFVSATASTVYKVQGETLTSMVIVDWKAGRRGGVDKREQAYLMLSRVVKRTGLLILKPFTRELASWYKPPEHSLREEERLLAESARCVAAFKQTENN